MKIWFRLLLVATSLFMGVGVQRAQATTPPPPADPAATLLTSNLSIGQKVIIRGTAWPSGKVSVQVCGNNGVNGTVDCDGPGTRSFGIGSSGKFAGQIVVGAPPTPCPCVVLVASNFAERVVIIPITIKDHPTLVGTPTADPNKGLTTLNLTSSFVRGDWWRDAVGISPARIMTITITNTGGNPTGDGVVDVTVGKDSPATGFAASISFESLDPGESTSVAAKFAVDSFAFGTYNMTARVTSPAAGGEITEQTSTFPGYLLVLLILIILIIDLIWMARVRRRRHLFATAEAAAAAARAENAAIKAEAEASAAAERAEVAAAASAREEAESLAAAEATEALLALLANENAGAGVDDPPDQAADTSAADTTDAADTSAADTTDAEHVDPAPADADLPSDEPDAPATSEPSSQGDVDQKPATIDAYFDSLLGDNP